MAKIAKIVIETNGELEDGKLTISLKEAKELQALLNELLEKEIVKEYVPYYPYPYVYEPYKVYPYTYPQAPYYTVTYGTNTDGQTWTQKDAMTTGVSVYCSKN